MSIAFHIPVGFGRTLCLALTLNALYLWQESGRKKVSKFDVFGLCATVDTNGCWMVHITAIFFVFAFGVGSNESPPS